MAHCALEVADVFRTHGPDWRKAQRGHLSLGQLKVMSAIEQCRSAALGGHVLRCEECGHDQIAYNSCLMGTLPIRGVRRSERREAWAARLLHSPLGLGLQQRDQSVRWPEPPLAKMRGNDCLNGFQLFARVGSNVDLRGGQVAVPQP